METALHAEMELEMNPLQAATEMIDKATIKLDALKHLFDVKDDDLKVGKDGFVYGRAVDLRTVFQNPNAAVSVVTYQHQDVGHPMHMHHNLQEYLIITKGRFLLKTDAFVRILDKGDCASIPQDLMHTTIPLTSDGELLAVCIPPEKSYEKLGE